MSQFQRLIIQDIQDGSEVKQVDIDCQHQVFPWMQDFDSSMIGYPCEDDESVKLYNMECIRFYGPNAEAKNRVKNNLDFKTEDYIEMFLFNRYIHGRSSSDGKPNADHLVREWSEYWSCLHEDTDKWVKLLRYQFACFRNHSPDGAMVFLHMKSVLHFGKCMVPAELGCPMCTPGTPKMTRVHSEDYADVKSALKTMDLVFSGNGTPKYGPPVNDLIWRNQNRFQVFAMMSGQELLAFDEKDEDRIEDVCDIPDFKL